MKKTFAIFLLLICFAAQQADAQVPGYRGKRFSVSYNASSFFYFSDHSRTSDDGIAGFLGSTRLSYKTELSACYTVSRKTNIGFSYYTTEQKNYSNNGTDEYIAMKLNIYELNVQFFKNNFVAPVGLYNQIAIGLVKYGVAKNSPNQNVLAHVPDQQFSCMKLSYHIGKKNPIGHNFFINTAFGLNIFTGGDYIGILGGTASSNYLLTRFNHTLRSYNSLEIKVGLGWLAF